MRTRLFTLTLLLCALMLTVIGTASAAEQSLKLISPAKNGTLKIPEPTFVWKDTSGSVSYIIALRSKDGAQSLDMAASSEDCIGNTCSIPFMTALYGWSWREDTTYTWQVRVVVGATVITKSKKASFTTSLLPAKIKLIGPADTFKLDGLNTGVNFQFKPNPKFDAYRIKLVLPDGTKHEGAWQSRMAICTTTCTYFYDLYTFPYGKFKWRIEGLRVGVTETIQSAKRKIIKQHIK